MEPAEVFIYNKSKESAPCRPRGIMTHTRFTLKPFICAVLLVCPLLQAHAQPVSPWFKGSKQTWNALLKSSAVQAVGRARASVPLSGAFTGYAVKTTASNWVYHRLNHSKAFSATEKKIILQHPQYENAVLGKLAYFHDREARLFNLLENRPGQSPADEAVFWRHQDLLGKTLAEVENFYKTVLPERFASFIFSKEEVARLLADPVQPPAFVLGGKEMQEFAALPTLQEQRVWTQNALRYTRHDLNALLTKAPSDLKPFEFDRYYLQKLRLNYFLTLQQVLENATEKRHTLIIRRKRVLHTDLPGAERQMTDAERLGFLHYHADKLREPGLNFLEPASASAQQYLQVQTLLARLTPVYEVYAVAEAFGAPYELALRHGTVWPELILGTKEGEKLRQLKGPVVFTLLPPRLEAVQRKMAAMRAQTPNGLAFYVHYYRLEREMSLYNTILSRERLFNEFRK